MFKKMMLAVACALVLTGCPATVPPKLSPAAPLSNPSLPVPVGKYVLNWKVITKKTPITDEHVYVGLTYDQSLQLKLMIEDQLRYIKDANSVMCFYRVPLKEQRCETIAPK